MDIIETTLLNKRVKILQPKEGFHASLDTVFLAAAIPAQSGDALLDVGCGVGSAGLCVMERVPGCALTGVDIQQPLIDLAIKNAALNGISERARFICSDIRQTVATINDRNFQQVLMNPPYLEDGCHTPSPNASRAIANGGDANLEDWIRFAFQKLVKGGTLTMIHRADRLDDVLTAFGVEDFGSIRVYPLWSKASQPAKRVIVSARKHKKAPLVMHAGMIIHQDDGKYTEDADKILLDKNGLL